MLLQLGSSYDPKFGGFGSAPKFPRPVEDYIMLYKFHKYMEAGKENEALNIKKMVTHTLDCMARGGVHDHIGGGFHRYSVDECWHGKFVPISWFMDKFLFRTLHNAPLTCPLHLQFHILRRCCTIRDR
jgi:uncharacterized protein YyaL (SSP411 family)